MSNEAYHKAVETVQDLHLEKYGELTQEQSDMISFTLGKIWNEEIPGVEFAICKTEESGE